LPRGATIVLELFLILLIIIIILIHRVFKSIVHIVTKDLFLKIILYILLLLLHGPISSLTLSDIATSRNNRLRHIGLSRLLLHLLLFMLLVEVGEPGQLLRLGRQVCLRLWVLLLKGLRSQG
jgi:hypothetical protein